MLKDKQQSKENTRFMYTISSQDYLDLYLIYSLFSVHNGKKSTDPQEIPLVQRGAKRKKAFKLPPLISSPDFRQMLIQKDADEKAEKLRKE